MSSLLMEAQARLMALRQSHQAKLKPQPPQGEVLPALLQALPSHLGWGSDVIRACVRIKQDEVDEVNECTCQTAVPPLPTPLPEQPNIPANATIRVYASVALAVLKQELSTTARVWWLLRHLDQQGRGWIMVDEARSSLTEKESLWRICGWRQLRNLLNAGEGIFWQRQNGRLWLRSLSKVATHLGVPRLQGQPVAVPISVLTERIGTVRAHLYATFHSSRESKPIARDTLTDISGVHRRTQRVYEKRVGVTSQPHYAIGKTTTPERIKKSHWERGHASFTLTDHHGWHGAKGETYIVWQLPNSYQGPHEHARRGRQKRINRQLKDLFMQGITGNVEWAEPVYYGNGRSAARVYNRKEHCKTIYWTSKSGYWYALSPDEH